LPRKTRGKPGRRTSHPRNATGGQLGQDRIRALLSNQAKPYAPVSGDVNAEGEQESSPLEPLAADR
jgi:hypothetical protein